MNFKIEKTTEETREGIKQSSSFSLPNNPSAMGMTPDQIRKAFWAPIIGLSFSVISELDRVIDRINEIFGDGETLTVEAKDLIGAINLLKKLIDQNVRDAEKDLEDHNEDITSHPSILTQLQAHYDDLIYCLQSVEDINTRLGTVTDEELQGGDIGGILDHFMIIFRSFNYKYETLYQIVGANKWLETPEQSVIPALNNTYQIAQQGKKQSDANRLKLVNITAQVNGISRTFTIDTFLNFVEFMRGAYSVSVYEDRDGDGEEERYEVYSKDLKTGDNVLIIEKGVPDFWFERNNDFYSFDEYTYGDATYPLVACYYGEQPFGRTHILESDYELIERYATSAGVSAQEAKDEATKIINALSDYIKRHSNHVELGKETSAPGENSTAVGEYCKSRGKKSFSGGSWSESEGDCSFSFGSQCKTKTNRSASMGQSCVSQGLRTFVFGEGLESCLESGQKGQAVFGCYNTPDEKALFILGDGKDKNNTHNLMVVYPYDPDYGGPIIKFNNEIIYEGMLTELINKIKMLENAIISLGGNV